MKIFNPFKIYATATDEPSQDDVDIDTMLDWLMQ